MLDPRLPKHLDPQHKDAAGRAICLWVLHVAVDDDAVVELFRF
jgi:hypothetical protein